ncbi:hypothetical protein HDU76_011415, partial [Blyttiomyces sp. JEL0837]
MSDIQSMSSPVEALIIPAPNSFPPRSSSMDDWEMITELSTKYLSLSRAGSGESHAGLALNMGMSLDADMSDEGDAGLGLGWGGIGAGQIHTIGEDLMGLFDTAGVQQTLTGIFGDGYVGGVMVPDIGGIVDHGDCGMDMGYGQRYG